MTEGELADEDAPNIWSNRDSISLRWEISWLFQYCCINFNNDLNNLKDENHNYLNSSIKDVKEYHTEKLRNELSYEDKFFQSELKGNTLYLRKKFYPQDIQPIIGLSSSRISRDRDCHKIILGKEKFLNLLNLKNLHNLSRLLTNELLLNLMEECWR